MNMLQHIEISVDAIDPNPHRDLIRNPINPSQVEKLVDSIERTGFWENVVVRKHPDVPGRFQLAYGHNRIEACRLVGLTKVRLPVADLGRWDMYCAMCLENDTQQTISPPIAFENVEAGLRVIEAAFEAIGPKGTEEDYNRYLERDLVSAAALTKSAIGEDRRNGNAFEQARSNYFKTNKVGQGFVVEELPIGNLRNTTIADVLKTHYAEKKEAEADKADEEAREAEEKANTEQEAEAKAKAEEEAAEKRRIAEEKRKEANEIGKGVVASKLLLTFETNRQMTDFVAYVRQFEIPKEHHKAAADYIQKGEYSGKKMGEMLDLWWYERSGQAEQDRKRAASEKARAAFRKRVKDGDYGTYVLALHKDIKATESKLSIATKEEAGRYCPIPDRLITATCEKLRALIDAAQELIDQLENRNVEAESWTARPNGQPKSLDYSEV
jgi:hypothetical protein